MRSFVLAFLVAAGLAGAAHAQDAGAPFSGAPEYIKKEPEAAKGMAPGLKATELSPKIRTFQLVFAKGDEMQAGLTEFAEKNHLTNAHFTGIGAFDKAVLGFSDPEHKAFRILRLNEEMDVTSLTGTITRDRDGNVVVHAHCVVALVKNGATYSGHIFEGHVHYPLEMYVEDSEPLSADQDAPK